MARVRDDSDVDDDNSPSLQPRKLAALKLLAAGGIAFRRNLDGRWPICTRAGRPLRMRHANQNAGSNVVLRRVAVRQSGAAAGNLGLLSACRLHTCVE